MGAQQIRLRWESVASTEWEHSRFGVESVASTELGAQQTQRGGIRMRAFVLKLVFVIRMRVFGWELVSLFAMGACVAFCDCRWWELSLAIAGGICCDGAGASSRWIARAVSGSYLSLGL